MTKHKTEIHKSKSLNQGFSLIELMITVAIVGILASIALPSYLETVRKTRRSDAMDALLNCSTEQVRIYTSKSPPSYLISSAAETENICRWDGTNFNSSEGHYTLAITNPNCTGGNSIWCFTITATAVGSQANDTDCATMAIDHRGIKTALDSTNTDSTKKCWKT